MGHAGRQLADGRQPFLLLGLQLHMPLLCDVLYHQDPALAPGKILVLRRGLSGPERPGDALIVAAGGLYPVPQPFGG